MVMTDVSTTESYLPIGGSVTISNTVKNQGTSSSSSYPFYSSLYLSTDETITTDDTSIGVRFYGNALAAGASASANTNATIPSVLTPGTYYLGAIADVYDHHSESDETNNALAGALIGVYHPIAPTAPTNASASGGNAQATVSFTAPADNGGPPVSNYTVTSTPDGITATGTTSPIIVTGLTNGTAYTFTVTATNSVGDSLPSAASNSVSLAGAAQAYFIHTDHLNTPREITNTAGNTVWTWDNTDPFGGNVATGTGQFSFNLRFPGQYFDQETNTHYNFYRDAYDPESGRYTQSDPIGLWGGLNTYGYVGGNPVGFSDPFGLSTAVVDRGGNTITVTMDNGQTITYPAGNNTTNPSGDPDTEGSNGPAPAGTWPVQPPMNTSGDVRYGPYFWPIGAVDAQGNRADIARQRGIGLHGGRRSYQSRTEGCVRMDDADILDLYQRTTNDPLTTIEIR